MRNIPNLDEALLFGVQINATGSIIRNAKGDVG